MEVYFTITTTSRGTTIVFECPNCGHENARIGTEATRALQCARCFKWIKKIQ